MSKYSSYLSDISSYYKQSNWLYKYFWYSSKSMGLHYGFWDKGTKNNDEAIINQYTYILHATHIKSSMNVLDAGCGVGGGAIYIAQHTHASVTGITISKHQVGEAKKNALRENVYPRVKCILADYTHTPFPDHTFDVIFAIESACHATPKKLFLDEMYRILKPLGTLIITDGYSKRNPKNEEEKHILRAFCHGWRLKELICIHDMTKAIRKAHFTILKIDDKTKAVEKSLKRMEKILIFAKPFIAATNFISLPILSNIKDNATSMDMSIKGVSAGLFGYFAYVLKKE